jgi:hypothetical protein
MFTDSIMRVADSHERSWIAKLSRLLRFNAVKRSVEAGLKIG